MKRFVSSLLATALVGAFALATVASPADAKACRDARGKFTKCAPTTTVKKPCRDAKGKFIKCHGATSGKQM
ncbi:MAG: hypothetical protein PVSMB8_05930 [Vulcanimicrobiaceae bacterium]